MDDKIVDSLKEIEKNMKVNSSKKVKHFYENNGLMVVLDVYIYISLYIYICYSCN